MNNEVRQRKVTELNRLLPMVHKTIEKHRQWINCSDEIDQKKEKLKELKNDIENINTTLSIISKQTSFYENANFELVLLKRRNQHLAEMLERNIVDLEEKCGLFEEILPKCINEYIYLLVIHDSFYKSFSIKRLFINPEDFKNLLNNLPKGTEKFVKNLLEGRGSTIEFFNYL